MGSGSKNDLAQGRIGQMQQNGMPISCTDAKMEAYFVPSAVINKA